MNSLEMAEQIARVAHAGQKDLSGDDYIAHVERVVALTTGDEAKTVAWLHDVVEDTSITLWDLCRAGFSDDVLEAVAALTRRGEAYHEYINSLFVCGPALAREVKLADLHDHLRPGCPERLRPRYEAAMRRFGVDV